MSRLSKLGTFLTVGLGLGGLVGGCSDVESPTDLWPEGDPKVLQVMMTENIIVANVANPVQSLAYGKHPDFPRADDNGEVVAGSAASNNKIRVILDELLIGNYLEQIACRDGQYRSVPEGATPDDVAACSVASDLLESSCLSAEHPVCVDVDGFPHGVLDENEDGASDDTRFIDGAVRVVCTNDGTDYDVELSLDGTYWQPSGNQQVPATGGFNAVGPAIVLQPSSRGYPTNSTCRIVFADSVVDKEHNTVCAPPDDGLYDEYRFEPCSEGTSEISFGMEVMRVAGSFPSDGNEGISLTNSGADFKMTVQYNVPVQTDGSPGLVVDADAFFTLLEGGVERTGLTAASLANSRTSVEITVPGGFLADTEYMLIVEQGSVDDYGIAMPEDEVRTITFTTGS